MYTFVLFISILVLLFCLFLKQNLNYWKRKGVPNPPVNLFFGNLLDVLTFKKSLGQIFVDIYKKYEDYAYVGFYKIQKPGLLIRDPELVKTVLIKEFSSFHDTDFDVDEKSDMLMAKNPFALKGNQWKVVRQQLTPCFTAGKVKPQFPFFQETCDKMVSYINRQMDDIGKHGFEAKELMSKYTTENVASCAFGLQGKCFDEPDAEFRVIGRKLLQPSLWLGIKHLIVFLVPSMAKFVNVKFIPDDIAKRLSNIVIQTLKYRKENNVQRNDFLDILNELKSKPGQYEFKDEDIIAHAAGFYGDGFETSSITLTFIVYEIAVNIHVQSKLREEIDRVLAKYDGKMTSEAIQEMTYLDSVFWEGMRKHPPVYNIIRKCTKPFCLPPPIYGGDGPKVTVEPGTPVWISADAIQNDEKYFPNPDKFDPERFNEENKKGILKGTFIAFGEGPRICLGQNFGIAQVKAGIVALVHNFEIRLNKKTASPLQLDQRYFMRSALGGIWLDFFKRQK